MYNLRPSIMIQVLDAKIREQAITRFEAQGGKIEVEFHGDTYIVSDLELFNRSYQEATNAVMANYSLKEQL